MDPRAASMALPSLEDLAARSRASADAKRSVEDLVMAKGPFGEVPRPPDPTPLDSAPSRPHGLLGRQHTSWVLGRLSAPHARLGPISGLMHGHAQAEESCRVVEKATRFMFKFRLKG